jgi:hypothetical protein
MSKTLRISLLAAFAMAMGVVAANHLPGPSYRLVSVAEAVVGRPLTPVSVAGVARRTSRRCATGVYNC